MALLPTALTALFLSLTPASLPQVQLESCMIEAVPRTALCGSVRVPQDYRHPHAGMTDLYLVLLRNDEAGPATGTALTLLTGGPGTAATGGLTGLLNAYPEAAARFDILVIDQRGTGRSTPLRCRPPLDSQALPSRLPEIIEPCPEPHPWQADARQFGTTMAARDLDAVRSALGYESLTIVARSYGTRLAQEYARRFPDHTRALLLKGVVPPGGHLTQSLAPEAETVLRSVFALCAVDASCSMRFPDLPGMWDRALAQLEDGAAGMVRLDPESPEVRVEVSRGLALSAIRSRLYSVTGMAGLPRLIEGLADGADDEFVGLTAAYATGLSAQIYDGMYLATTCGEDIAFVDVATAREEAAGTFLGDYRIELQQAACADWPAMELEPGFKTPLAADVPILALNGSIDPATSPGWAAQALTEAPNARLVIVPNRSHALVRDEAGCLAGIETQFLLAADPLAIDSDCVAGLAFPGFDLGEDSLP